MSSFRRGLMMAQGGGKSALEPCIYTTTKEKELVYIIARKEYAQRIYLEDGTELDVSGTGFLGYTFPNAGEHKVWIELKQDIEDLSNCFNNTQLEVISKNLLQNVKKVNNFTACFTNTLRLRGETPKDEDGGELWEREGKEGYPNKIDGTDCFWMCTGLSNYNSIPDDWK